MKRNNILFALAFLTLILFVNGALAEDPSQSFEVGKNAKILFSCSYANSFCNASTTCNVTINNPDSSLLISNKQATKIDYQYNYTLNPSQTLVIGEYKVNAICFNGATPSDVKSFSIKVNPSPYASVSNYYWLILVVVYFIIALGIWKQDITITLLGTLGLYFIGLYILFYGVDIIKNTYTNAFAFINLGVAFYLSVRMALEYFNE